MYLASVIIVLHEEHFFVNTLDNWCQLFYSVIIWFKIRFWEKIA